MAAKVQPRLTDAQRDAIDAQIRALVTGSADKVTLIEVTGEMHWPLPREKEYVDLLTHNNHS